MSTKKTESTLSGRHNDIATRVSDVPLIKPSGVPPSDPKLQVIGVLNPTFIKIGGVKYLIVRIDERPSGMAMRSRPSGIGREPLLVAYADLEYAGKVEVIETNLHRNFLEEGDPMLPQPVREFCLGARQQELLLSYISHLRLCELCESGIHIKEKPLAYPCDVFSQYGCEDPRCTVIDGRPLITYTAIGRYGATSWLATIQDESIREKRMILGPDHKHSTIFPEHINGSYFLLTRPLSRSYLRASGIWILESPDMVHWGSPLPVLLPRPGMWDEVRVGPSGAPLLIDQGWLLFYYGVDHENTYRVGAALLDQKEPSRVIGRTEHPVLSPTLEWERFGRRADTVFPCGAELLTNDNSIRLYYGAADTSVGAADVNKQYLLEKLL